MFRKATMSDLDAVSAIYDAIHAREEAGLATIGWIRGVYPVRATAEASILAGTMFVMEEDGRIIAAAKIDQEQGEAYRRAAWEHPADDGEVMVLHTLVVLPEMSGRGAGTRFVDFYEDYAARNGCPFLRMDTNARNLAARALYKKLGYCEADIVPCVFNGIPGVDLVCLEKKLSVRAGARPR
ncbi:MAG: GNAT family N-acetyltransferase [Mailhella sp.]|nr:GNAT family N-acetyltransferase [Mailhella sp.]